MPEEGGGCTLNGLNGYPLPNLTWSGSSDQLLLVQKKGGGGSELKTKNIKRAVAYK